MSTLKVPVWLLMVLVMALLLMAAGNVALGVMYDNTSQALTDLRGDVDSKNQEAEDKLAELTKERDARQAELERQYIEGEVTDAQRVEEIQRLTGELRDRPVRVRYLSAPGGSSGGGADGKAIASAQPGAENPSASSGVLPDANTRRLVAAVDEVEVLSAAYASCRQALTAGSG